MKPVELDPNTRDIDPDVLDDQGRMRILSAAYWATTTESERALFGHRHGIYSFPTVELVEYLRSLIAGRSAIEIGAGNGVLADALGIPATDSKQQVNDLDTQLHLMLNGQPPVSYGPNVIELDARRAVNKYRPQVVIACWVTNKYERHRHAAGGNMFGVREEEIIRDCEDYVFVGNEKEHTRKKIWSQPHTIEYPSFVYSRAINGSRDFVAVWKGGRSRTGK